VELINKINWLTKIRAALLAALFSVSVSAWGQVSPCDLNHDGVVDSADVALAVDMTQGKAACTSNIEGPGACTILTVQRVTSAAQGRECVVSNSSSGRFAIASPNSGGRTSEPNARLATSNGSVTSQLAASGLQFYPITPCRLVDTRGLAAGFNGIAPFSGPSIAAGGTLTIPVQSAAEAAANTAPAPCGVIPSTAQAYSFNLTIVPHAGGAVNYVSMWPAGSTRPYVSTLDDPEGLIVDNAAIIPAGTFSGGVSVYNSGPSATDVILDMNGYFAPPATGLQFYPVAPCRLVDTRGVVAGFNGIAPFSGPSIAAGGTLTIPVQSAAEASAGTAPAPCGVIPSTAQAYSFNLTVVPHAGGAVNYVSMWPSGSPRPFVATLDDPQGQIAANAAIVPAGSSGGVSVYNAGPAATDVVLDMNGYFAAPTSLEFYPVTPCRLVDTRGVAAGFNGVAPFSGPSIAAGGTLTIPVQSAAEASANTTPAPCGVIPSTAQAYSFNLTIVPHAGGAVDYVSMWPSGSARPFVATLDDVQGEIVSNAAIVPAGTSSGGVSVYNSGPSATDVILDMNGYFAPPAGVVLAPVITSALSAGGSTGNAFSYQITASNSSTSYSAAGLPAGLSVNAATGLISGTPTAVGVSTVTLGATNSAGTGNAILTLTIATPDPLDTLYKPAMDTNPGDYPSNIWITGPLSKVLQDSGTPGAAHWATVYTTQNEIQSFQVHVRAAAGPINALSVTMSDLVNAQTGTHISAASTDIVIYREAYENVNIPTASGVTFLNTLGHIPDILIPAVDPYYHQTTNAFPFTVLSGNNQSVWIDVHTPPTAPSGYYSGTVTVSSGATVLASMPVVYVVWDWQMPSTASLPSFTQASYGGFCTQVYGSIGGCSAYPGSQGSGDYGETWTDVDASVQMLDNRYSLAGITNVFPGAGSFASFDAVYGPLFSGTPAHVTGILQGARLTSYNLVPLSGQFNSATFQDFQNHFSANGWVPPIYGLWDEPNPYDPTVWATLIANGNLEHTFSTPIIPNMVTTDIVTAGNYGALNTIDRLVVNLVTLEPGAGFPMQNLSTYQNWLSGSPTRRFWSYQGCSDAGTCTNGIPGPEYPGYPNTYPNYDIDGTPVANRLLEWLTYLHGQTGELYYYIDVCDSIPCGYPQLASPNPLISDYYSGGWGDGTLMYPGSSAYVGTAIPIWLPSMRLKMIRDGMQDYEYLNMLTTSGYASFAAQEAYSFITNSYTFSNDPAALEAAREAMGTKIHQLMLAQAALK
jgi:hypothetical protein